MGDLTKTEVRRKARHFALPMADKHDSQGLCFVGDVSMRDFLKRFITVESGDVLNTKGEVIGRHDGAALYTLGQRHGFTIDGEVSQKPHYVTSVNTGENRISVSENKIDAASVRICVRDLHWVGKLPTLPVRVQAQTRYRETPVPIRIDRSKAEVVVTFDQPHIASPGQSIVFYDGEICLGGAIIDSLVERTCVHSAS